LLVAKINGVNRPTFPDGIVGVSIARERDHELITNAYSATFAAVLSVTVIFSGVTYDVHTVVVLVGSAPTERTYRHSKVIK
jgi:hypothetical protein